MVYDSTLGGFCDLHRQPLPCPCRACSTAPAPVQATSGVFTPCLHGYYPSNCPHCPKFDPLPTPLPLQFAPAPAYGFQYLPDHCEHCFCVILNTRPEHEQCCNCGIQRLKAKSE